MSLSLSGKGNVIEMKECSKKFSKSIRICQDFKALFASRWTEESFLKALVFKTSYGSDWEVFMDFTVSQKNGPISGPIWSKVVQK